MKEKEMAVYNILKQSVSWTTAQQLALSLNVSKRTIHNYILKLQDKDIEIISSPQGYKLKNITQQQQEEDDDDDDYPSSKLDRQHYLLKLLITNNNDFENPISLNDLEEELYVSTSTIKKDLKRVKVKLHKFSINLKIEKEDIWIEGAEYNKRKLMSEILYEESHKEFINTSFIQHSFPHLPINDINNIIKKILLKYQFYMNDYAYMNFLLHIAIAIDRMEGGLPSFPVDKTYLLSYQHLAIAKEIGKHLEKICNITFDENEIDQLCLMLLSENSLKEQSLTESIHEEYIKFTEQLLKELKEWYLVDVEEKDFILRFAIHLHHLVLRCRIDRRLHNPLAQNIKINCPLIYEIAIYISTKIQDTYNIILSDDEIAYIALHIGGGVENKKKLEEKIKCYLFCPQYHNIALDLANHIRTNFDDSLWIMDIIQNNLNEDIFHNADLIISTHNIESCPVRVAVVTPFFIEQDVQLLQKVIMEINKEKNDLILQQQLQYFFSPDLFTIDHIKTQYEAISYICNILVKKNIVYTGFENEILERERLSSTSFGLVAIPHSMRMNAYKTKIYVWINPDGIKWNNDTTVKIILLLTTNQDERSEFKLIFQFLTKIFIDQTTVDKLSYVSSYDEFISELMKNRNP